MLPAGEEALSPNPLPILPATMPKVDIPGALATAQGAPTPQHVGEPRSASRDTDFSINPLAQYCTLLIESQETGHGVNKESDSPL